MSTLYYQLAYCYYCYCIAIRARFEKAVFEVTRIRIAAGIMKSSMLIVALVVILPAVTAFTFGPAMPLRQVVARSTRPAQKSRVNTNMMDVDYHLAVAQISNTLLLAADSDGSKTDRLYNGIPLTGNVE